MTDKWIGPRVLCGDSNPPPDGYEYVRRYADDVRLAAGSGTTVENENVAGYVAFRRDWMRRHGLRAERCSLVDVTGDSMEPELFDGDSLSANMTETVRRERRPYLAGANPARQLSLQPVAVGAAEGGNDLG